MFTDKESVNILTSLLESHGVKHVVVCPGSRNAPLVHNFNESRGLTCWPVTDERSAGFFALGLSQATDTPVAVCVTSGSALLNVAPAVAEASYQHRGLVVISADRPEAWIEQLDGQTLRQRDVFGHLVSKSVTLPEVHDDTDRWFCNRLVNEALLAVRRHGRKSVHINVPLSEPLFHFTQPTLTAERVIEQILAEMPSADDLLLALTKAERPLVVVGQMPRLPEAMALLQEKVVVLYETLSGEGAVPFDEMLRMTGDDERYRPDLILYMGDTIVSKRLKHFLRQSKQADVWEISLDGEVHDTFMQVRHVIEGDASRLFCFWDCCGTAADGTKAADLSALETTAEAKAFKSLWEKALAETAKRRAMFRADYSQMAAVKVFEEMVPPTAAVHYANSMSIRLANIFARHHVYCNRGVNGIEGSLSTAVGFSCGDLSAGENRQATYIVIGDLSFFYDSNGLWNQNMGGALRVLLLNNSQGGIFNMLEGLEQSQARAALVAGEHYTSAEGLCRAYHLEYHAAHDMEELKKGVSMLVRDDVRRPVVLEVFTHAEQDARVYREYLNSFI